MSSNPPSPTPPFSYTVPFVGNHSSMVIGSKGKCIQSFQKEFGVNIKAMKADTSKNLPVPYFLIEGNERDVLYASLKVHSLLSLSMGRSEKELKAKNELLTKEKSVKCSSPQTHMRKSKGFQSAEGWRCGCINWECGDYWCAARFDSKNN